MMDKAFSEGDFATVLSFYEDAAVLVTEPGKTARGKDEIRRFFEQVGQSGSSAKQHTTYVLEADGLALFLSRWSLEDKQPDGTVSSGAFVATTVFRKQADGGWKALIDNAFGPLVLEAE
jgi:ketosteroid isomerase-like protein